MQKRIFGLASVALLSCRAVLGIEELEVVDGGAGSDAGADGSSDGGPDARADAPTDAGGGAKTDVSACVAKPDLKDCSMCCRDSFPTAVPVMEQTFKACVCASPCATTNGCDTTLCAGKAVAGTDCPKCVDDVVRNGSCKKESDECANSPSCEPALTCLRSCK